MCWSCGFFSLPRHRRADAQLRLGEQSLHRLRHDMRGGVPQDRPAVVAGDLYRLDVVPLGEWGSQVMQFPVDPCRDHGHRDGGCLRYPQGTGRSRASFHHMLAPGEDDVKLLGWHS